MRQKCTQGSHEDIDRYMGREIAARIDYARKMAHRDTPISGLYAGYDLRDARAVMKVWRDMPDHKNTGLWQKADKALRHADTYITRLLSEATNE